MKSNRIQMFDKIVYPVLHNFGWNKIIFKILCESIIEMKNGNLQ